MKQTAVEYLVKELNEKAIIGGTVDRVLMNNIIEKAKEMEKQQKGYSEEETMEFFIEGYKQRAEKSDLIFDNASRMYAIHLFEQFKNK